MPRQRLRAGAGASRLLPRVGRPLRQFGRKQIPMRELRPAQESVFAWLSDAIHSPAAVRTRSSAPRPRPRLGPAWAAPVVGDTSPRPGCARPPEPTWLQVLLLEIHRWWPPMHTVSASAATENRDSQPLYLSQVCPLNGASVTG